MAADATVSNLYVPAAGILYQVPVSTGVPSIVGGNGLATVEMMSQTFARLQDGIGTAARPWALSGSAFDATRNLLWLSDTKWHTIMSVSLAPGAGQFTFTTVAGRPYQAGFLDAIGLSAQMNTPKGLAMWHPRMHPLAPNVSYSSDIPITDLLFFVDSLNAAVRQLNVVTGEVSTLAIGDVDTFGFQSPSLPVDVLDSLILSPDASMLYLTCSTYAVSPNKLWSIDVITRVVRTMTFVTGFWGGGFFPSLPVSTASGNAAIKDLSTLILPNRQAFTIMSLNLTAGTISTVVGRGRASCVTASKIISGSQSDGGPALFSTYMPSSPVVDKVATNQRLMFTGQQKQTGCSPNRPLFVACAHASPSPLSLPLLSQIPTNSCARTTCARTR